MPGLAVQTVASEAGGGVSRRGHVEEGTLQQKNANRLQQMFQMLCELNCKVETHRKEQSIPGSVTLVTAQQELFGKEELQALNLNSKINREGKGIWPKTSGIGCSY